MKTCTSCGVTSDVAEFRKHRRLCVECDRKRAREYHHANSEAMKKRMQVWNQEKRFNLGPGGYQILLDAQGGVCAICGTDEPGPRTKMFAIDHDHTCCDFKGSCGKCIRGLLCSACNGGLGRFADDPERLRKAAEYVGQKRILH